MTDTTSTRDRILAVARDLFTSRGFDAVSIRDIVAAAGVNLGAVTYHFGSKEALYHAAIASMAEPFAARVGQIAHGPGAPLDRVEAVMRAALAHLIENPGAPVILLRELASDHPLPPPMAKLMRQNIGAMAEIIADGQRDGSIRAGDPRLLAITAISQGFFIRAARRLLSLALDADADAADQQARIVDHVIESVRRSIANTPQVPS